MSNKNLLVAQSGGPTAAINASLAGVVSQAIKDGYHVFGSINGIVGVLNDNLCDLSEKNESIPDFIESLKRTPAMYLGSCRYKLKDPANDTSDFDKIFDLFNKMSIDAFCYIGGNDSQDTVVKLAAYGKKIGSNVHIIGVPKTIDNDLCEIDHSPGFGSACKYVATSIREIAYDISIYPVKSVTIVEVMGRDAGWLTSAACLARTNTLKLPQLIYLPEAAFSKEEFIADVKDLLEKEDHILIAISEGIRDKDGNYVSASESKEDTFGHSQLSGAGKTLEYLIKDTLGVKVRSIELNLPQRCATHLASATDINEAFALGENAVKLAETESGLVSILRRISDTPYTVKYDSVDATAIANNVKAVPREWINSRGNDVTAEMVQYLSPLVVGELDLCYEAGFPKYLEITHL